MPDILIRGLEPHTIRRLKTRAKQNHRSLQSEAKMVLQQAAGYTLAEALAGASSWRKKLRGPYADSTELLREDRQR